MKYPRTKNKRLNQNFPLLKQSFAIENAEMQSILAMMEKLLHWAAIVDSSDDAIISKSLDGYITSWNKGAQRLYGYTADEIIGKPVSMLMPPEKKDDFPYIMKALHEGRRVEHYETQRVTKDGRIIHVSITVSPIRDSQGNIIGASKIARDITDRIENERRRDEFVSTASHELKTPITSQRVFGELLEKIVVANKYAELKPYVRKINQQTDKMTKLVEDLLELSRTQTARLKIEHEKFSISDLINEIVDTTQMTTKHAIIQKGRIKDTVVGDRERIGQVVTNLLANAAKYSPKADIIIVHTKTERNEVIVSIQDFGIGIAKEYHHKVFERFFRVTDADEKTYPGMGIGLFLSNEIISRHGGRLWVESKKGKGATFFFTLPLVKSPK